MFQIMETRENVNVMAWLDAPVIVKSDVKDKDHLNSNSAETEDHGKENTDINHLPIK